MNSPAPVTVNDNDQQAARRRTSTEILIKQTLCAGRVAGVRNETAKRRELDRPFNELLPSLTSSTDVDLELYAILSVVIKEAVQSWYGKITTDHEFVDGVIDIIAHCTRNLEQRLSRVDFLPLLLDEIPALVEGHILAYHAASSIDESVDRGGSVHAAYHALRPHPALASATNPSTNSSDSSTVLYSEDNEATWRQLLISGILKNLLPTQDMTNPCLEIMVQEILSEMILGDAIDDKLCQGWFIWDMITNTITKTPDVVDKAKGTSGVSRRLEAFGLVDERPKTSVRSPGAWSQTFLVAVMTLLDMLMIVFGFLQKMVYAYQSSNNLPMRTAISGAEAIPFLEMTAWSLPCLLIDAESSMPWLTGIISLARHSLISGPGKLAGSNSRMDRLLVSHIQSQLDPTRLPNMLRSLRTTLFPNDALGPAKPIPDANEVIQIKARCVTAILQSMPVHVRKVYFGTPRVEDGNARRRVERLLDVFGDAYLNKHLICEVIDTVVARVFPEMCGDGLDVGD